MIERIVEYGNLDVWTLLPSFNGIDKIRCGTEWLIARSISYFNDAEEDEDPKLFLKSNWIEVKETISKEALIYFG